MTCRHCMRGYSPDSKGEHWITISLRPPTVKIAKCPDWKDPEAVWSTTLVIEGAALPGSEKKDDSGGTESKT